jgi:hypothetical protein
MGSCIIPEVITTISQDDLEPFIDISVNDSFHGYRA